MNIVMVTNTYLPHVGGVANSVRSFADEYRKRGHRVLILCPQFPGAAPAEKDVLRAYAIQNFNGTDFSVVLPISGALVDAVEAFKPDIVHSHHPFLLGHTALRLAARLAVPIVFTHHTMYEQYTHYVPADSPQLQDFAKELSIGYGNLCNAVIAPSESIRTILLQRKLEAPVYVVPTGVDTDRFGHGDGSGLRRVMAIPADAFVVGHVGRLALEKNLAFLAQAVSAFLREHEQAYFLIVGDGPSVKPLRKIFKQHGVHKRVRLAGTRIGQELVNAYHAMDAFAFASLSETQGMVLMEAMACGVPVVALKAPGASDVVRDGQNGYLLLEQNVEDFTAALGKIAALPAEERKAFSTRVKEDAELYSIARSADQALSLYGELAQGQHVPRDAEGSSWWLTLRRIEAEWEIWSNVAGSFAHGMLARELRRTPLLRYTLLKGRKLRRSFTRSEWVIKLFGLRRYANESLEPGLILLQIDGLGRSQFESALRNKRLPFLRRLIHKEDFKLRTFYAGVPSTTPAVQAELFYGQKCAVPAFEFYDRETGTVSRMYNHIPSSALEAKCALESPGLLTGGSSYSNIFSGGATYSHFCAASMGWSNPLGMNPLKLLTIGLYGWSIVKVFFLMLVEVALAFVDFLHGVTNRFNFWKELKFISFRVGISVMLREIITIGALIDATRGVPVIHVNFLGYDEQAHRRGPSSAFAHWSLKGIDGAIKRIFSTARSSTRRDYEVWIYSDHGQEETVPYSLATGKDLAKAIGDVFKREIAFYRADDDRQRGEHFSRRGFKQLSKPDVVLQKRSPDSIAVTAMGPLGHIYLPAELLDRDLGADCAALVRDAGIPLVLRRESNRPSSHTVRAWTIAGEFVLPRDAERLLGAGHPFARQVGEDFLQMCLHKNSGDIIISGWRSEEQPMSFVFEHGAHGGPGREETRGFVLLPAHIPVSDDVQDSLRPIELRELALEALDRSFPRRSGVRNVLSETFRVMTYNVHSCVGVDDQLSIDRIARIIAYYNPDIIALQELDVGRARTRKIHQAEEIALALGMKFHFHPPLVIEEELYGNAILSKFPVTLRKADRLPKLENGKPREPRGALWVEADVHGTTLQVVNTHLGLNQKERELQVKALLGPEWLGHPDCREPVILLGDFNAYPYSKPYKIVIEQLKDVQLNVPDPKPQSTWQSRLPISRIDHIFTSDDLEVANVMVARTSLCRIASDHLPLIADLRLKPEAEATTSPPETIEMLPAA